MIKENKEIKGRIITDIRVLFEQKDDSDTSTSSQVSNCNVAVLETYLDHNFQWPQEGLKSEFLAYKVIT